MSKKEGIEVLTISMLLKTPYKHVENQNLNRTVQRGKNYRGY
jgi:hypothetical protein